MISSGILQPAQRVQTETSGFACEVKKLLGAGGQGEVYLADLNGKPVALKWYYSHSATRQQHDTLDRLVSKGAPNDKFLWPQELVSAPGVLSDFGYIMPLREERYKGIIDLMKKRINPSFRALTTAGFQLADSYYQLHAQGLCYRDISFGNVFFDPKTGEILICDNDNVGVDGEVNAGVLGTARFMAPEIVRKEAVPSTKTDLFSLAVLLFYLFIVHHPLEGLKEASIKCLDEPAMTKLYGSEPVFIFDPSDFSNTPVSGYQDNALIYWPIYPVFFRNLFIKAFTDGIKDPENGRVREGQWRNAMITLRDSIVYCISCGAENFYDSDTLKASGGKPQYCWSCRQVLHWPFRIRIGKNIIMLNHDTKLYPHHLNIQRAYDFSRPVAEVTQHPTNPGLWGLRNLSNERWIMTKADGAIQEVEPGRNVPLITQTQINFGNTQGEIRY